VAAFIITRIQVGDYDGWRALFDQDRRGRGRRRPCGASFAAWRTPIRCSSCSVDDAKEARRRLVESEPPAS
jgi:hypothetical protein